MQEFIKIGRDINASNPKIQSFDCEPAPGETPEHDADYVGYTARHLFQRVAEHKKVRQSADIFMMRMLGATSWMKAILRFWERTQANLIV